jgi:hypothetical protein
MRQVVNSELPISQHAANLVRPRSTTQVKNGAHQRAEFTLPLVLSLMDCGSRVQLFLFERKVLPHQTP